MAFVWTYFQQFRNDTICKGPKRPIFRGFFLLLGQGVKIQKLKTTQELIAWPMGFVWTYFEEFRKDKICKLPKKGYFSGVFRYLVKVLKYKSLKQRRNWSLGPWDSFGPIFSSSEKKKFSKGLKKALFKAFFCYLVKVWIYKSLTPRGNWSLGPWDSFRPIFSSSKKIKFAKAPERPIFRVFFATWSKCEKYKSLTPRGNWSLGPWDSFRPIFSSSERIKFAKGPKRPIFRVCFATLSRCKNTKA